MCVSVACFEMSHAHEVMVVVAASWFLAQIVPFFSDFVTLLGATVTPVIAFIIPILLYRLCAQANDTQPIKKTVFTANLQTLRLSLLGLSLESMPHCFACFVRSVLVIRDVR